MVAVAPRLAQPLDLLEASARMSGWQALEGIPLAREHRQAFEPDDDLALFVFRLSQSVEGRAFIEHLMDITIRQPLRITGRTIEETALLAAARQGINGVGEAVLAMIEKGRSLSSNNGNGAEQ